MSKTVLVSGASSGIGEATAMRLLDAGHTVYGAARRVEKMKGIERRGARILSMDVTREEDLHAALARIGEEEGGVDVLVNNAGFGMYGAMEDTPVEDARYQFEVNLFGLARLTQLVLPYMRKQRAGTIVNVSSMGGKIYMPLGSWYHATKHALEGWSDCLRLEVAPFGIDVVIVEPGIIGTEFDEVMVGPMLERSGSSAYSELARKMADATRSSYGPRNASPPSEVAEVIARAIRERKPKTRYAVGKMARPLMFARKWLGDRMFDRLLRMAM